MKRLLFLACLASAMPALNGCVENPEIDNEPAGGSANTFSLVGVLDAPADNADTRTELVPHETKADTYYSHWTAGDRIAVYTGEDETNPTSPWTTYTLKEGSTSTEASFTGSAAAIAVPWYERSETDATGRTPFCVAVYPAEGAWEDGTMPLNNTQNHWVGGTIPVEQTYRAGNISPDVLPMVGVWRPEDASVVFKHIGALLHLQIYSTQATTLSKATLTSLQVLHAGTDRRTTLAGSVGVNLPETRCNTTAYKSTANKYLLYTPSGNWDNKVINSNQNPAYTVTLKGPIELSTDPDAPTDLWFVVNPADYANGFTLTLIGEDGHEMEKVLPATTQRNVKPGCIYRLPKFEYAGTTLDHQTAIETISLIDAIEANYASAKVIKNQDGTQTLDIQIKKPTEATVGFVVRIDKSLEGVLFKDVPRTSGSNASMMTPTADGNFLCQGGGYGSTVVHQSPVDGYLFYVRPAQENATGSPLETQLELVTDRGQTLGYVHISQVSAAQQVESRFANVALTSPTDNSYIRMYDHSLNDENFYTVAIMDEDFAGEISLGIAPGRNNIPQRNGIALFDFHTYGLTEWQKADPADFVSFLCGADPEGTAAWKSIATIKSEQNTAEKARDKRIYWCDSASTPDEEGNHGLGSLSIVQFGTNTYSTTGYHADFVSGNATLTTTSDQIGQLNLNDGTEAGSGVIYRSYTLTLASGAATTEIKLANILGMFDADAETGRIVNILSTPEWLTCTGAPNNEQDRSYIFTIDAAANTTGQPREADLEIVGISIPYGVVYGTLKVVQPAQ